MPARLTYVALNAVFMKTNNQIASNLDIPVEPLSEMISRSYSILRLLALPKTTNGRLSIFFACKSNLLADYLPRLTGGNPWAILVVCG